MVGLGAAGVVTATIIAVPMGARWLGLQSPAPAAVSQSQPQSAPPVLSAGMADVELPPSALPPPAAPARPKPTTTPPNPTAARATARPAPPPKPAVNPPATAATNRATAARARLVTPPPKAAAAPRAAAVAAAPTGRFFEPTDVDEPPRIATRVEPKMPSNLRGRKVNDVVIVRILVSQSGHAARVNVLRRSKLGSTLDDAVVAAVSQWTFSPATKRGEAVSSWYNVGVPLSAGN